ncbi:Hypothetical protein CINCED_3A015687 [Cinara cedri]|uniref:Uncharacterized protein n=1 Tax=Cinara cedri TaxID=506608 RepID=A0A5E4MC30_9HEMI|nr:Hypothetical protein CINCED_3A015687 [Cinara cedri]
MAEMDGTSRNHKKDDIMRIRNYTFPSILMEILEIDRYIVNCHDAILENPSNVMDINIANMLDDYIVYNFLQGMVKGRKSVEFAMDLLRVFNFYQEKQLLYNNEVKRDLINKISVQSVASQKMLYDVPDQDKRFWWPIHNRDPGAQLFPRGF